MPMTLHYITYLKKVNKIRAFMPLKNERNDLFMKIGTLVYLTSDVDAVFAPVRDLGLDNCQLGCWEHSLMTDEIAEKIKETTKKYGITITAFWCGWSGPSVWDFFTGPHTLGIVPSAYRFIRCKELQNGSDFAKKIGVKNVITHLGFIPEVPTSTEYFEVLATVKKLVQYMDGNGQNFLFETGQETPVTLKRLIEDTGMKNVGINLDPANLIMYGKANPVDALEVFGEYVMGVHAKDGKYPTNINELGHETRIGEGKVNFPAFIAKLKEVGYDGAVTIEREISGEKQIKDIKASITYLNELIG